MDDQALIRLLPDSLKCYQREDDGETTYFISGAVRADPSLTYTGIYLQCVAYDENQGVLNVDDRSIDLDFGVQESTPFQWRYDLRDHLAVRTHSLAVRVRASVFDVDKSVQLTRAQLIEDWRWRPEMPVDPPSMKDHVDGVRLLFRKEDDGDVRLTVLGTMPLSKDATYDNLRIDLTALDSNGHVVFRDETSVYEDWACASPYAFQQSLYMRMAAFQEVHAITVRTLARRQAHDGPVILETVSIPTHDR